MAVLVAATLAACSSDSAEEIEAFCDASDDMIAFVNGPDPMSLAATDGFDALNEWLEEADAIYEQLRDTAPPSIEDDVDTWLTLQEQEREDDGLRQSEIEEMDDAFDAVADYGEENCDLFIQQ